MKTRYIVGTRPQDAPAGHLIHNAPRPLHGDKTWQGDFISGIFYAAIDPDGDGAEWFIQQNQNLDASELRWVTMDEAVEGGFEWYDHNMPKLADRLDLDNQDHREWLADKFMEVSRVDA